MAVLRDTIILLPDTTDFYINPPDKLHAGNLYQKLEESSSHSNIARQIHNIILVPSKHKDSIETETTEQSEAPFLNYTKYFVRKIVIRKLDVFGPTVYTPDVKADNWLSQVGNRMHIKTNDMVLNRYILFKKGDKIDPYTFADNERILRELPFIEDARIVVNHDSLLSDSADVVIYVKDVWSKGFDIDYRNGENIKIDLWDNNIAGTGQQNEFRYYFEPDKKPIRGLDGYYKVSNIEGSFIDAQLLYSFIGNNGYGINFSRSFYTPGIKYAGEVNYLRNETYTLQNVYGLPKIYVPLSYTYTYGWVGRSFPWTWSHFSYRSRPSAVISTGIFDYGFGTHPLVTANTNYLFQTRTLYLISLAYSQQGFYKSNLVYSFGRTEDIPYGILINYTNGFEHNEFKDRMYYNLKIAEGSYLSTWGYLYNSISLGSFFNHGAAEQGMLRFNMNYFTNLFVLRELKFRHFLKLQYIRGYNRNSDERLSFKDTEGIRSLSSDSATGTQKLLCTWESVSFLPYSLIGFRIALYGFTDLGMIGDYAKPSYQNTFYSAVGMGVRLRNEHLVFKTLQLRFSYFPKIPGYTKGHTFYFSTTTSFNLENFLMKGPVIENFK